MLATQYLATKTGGVPTFRRHNPHPSTQSPPPPVVDSVETRKQSMAAMIAAQAGSKPSTLRKASTASTDSNPNKWNPLSALRRQSTAVEKEGEVSILDKIGADVSCDDVDEDRGAGAQKKGTQLISLTHPPSVAGLRQGRQRWFREDHV